jgi:hypothetical protein
VPFLLLVFLVTGIVLAFSGYTTLRSIYTFSSNVVQSSGSGVSVFASHYPTAIGYAGITSASVTIRIQRIDPELDTAVLSIICSLQTQFDSKELLFGAQVPYNSWPAAPDWHVYVSMQKLLSPGKSVGVTMDNEVPNPYLTYSSGFDQPKSLTYFWVSVNRMMNRTVYYDSFWFNATIILKSPLLRTSYSVFELINRFDYAPEIGSRIPSVITPLNPFDTVSYLFDMAQVPGSTIQSAPIEDKIFESEGTLWYQWDLSRLSPPMASGAVVVVDLQVLSLVTEHDQSLFMSSLFLGTGVPLTLSSLLELVKLTRESYEGSHRRGKR